MKRLFLILAILTVVLAAKAPATASAQMAPRFSMTGTFLSVDTAGTLLVHVRNGSPNIQPYIGTDLAIKTGPETIYVVCTALTCTRTQLSKLVPGDRVSISGVVRPDKSLYAWRVTIKR